MTYALEGSIFSTGSVIQWLVDGLKILERSVLTTEFSSKLGTNEELYFVPALAGLGAPYWDSRARGMIIGITGGTTRADIIRAALESICYQSRDVLQAFEISTGRKIDTVRVDGGGSTNDFLMQFFADITGKEVQRAQITETTALGTAQLAGLAFGFWNNLREIEDSWRLDRRFVPKMKVETRDRLYQKWQDGVSRSRSWAQDKS